jgi:GNAT superfamily N-acetyltransferase
MKNNIAIRTVVTPEDILAFNKVKTEYFIRDIFLDIDLGAPCDEEAQAHLLSEDYRNCIDALCSRSVDKAYRVFFESDGVRVGFALYCTYLSEDAKCFILDFCIFPEFRCKGLGKRCFEALTERAAQEGAEFFELNTHCRRSMRFWQSIGFAYNGYDRHGSILLLHPPQSCEAACTELGPDDIWQILNLENGYKKEIGEPFLSEEQQTKLTKAIENRDIRFFVLMHKTRVIGMCSVCRIFSTYICTPAAIFEDFFIEPVFRGKGYARMLTRYVQDWCAANGVTSLWVGSSETDVPMYRALGFDVPLGSLLTWNMD